MDGIRILMKKRNKNQEEVCQDLQSECCKTCKSKEEAISENPHFYDEIALKSNEIFSQSPINSNSGK